MLVGGSGFTFWYANLIALPALWHSLDLCTTVDFKDVEIGIRSLADMLVLFVEVLCASKFVFGLAAWFERTFGPPHTCMQNLFRTLLFSVVTAVPLVTLFVPLWWSRQIASSVPQVVCSVAVLVLVSVLFRPNCSFRR